LNSVPTYSEEELVQLLKQKGREAFNYLYRQYSAVLYGVIFKVINDEQTAQDVLQEAFVKIWNNVGQYDPQKGRLYTWMLNIARNAAIDKLRSRGEIMKSKIHTGEHVVDNQEQKLQTEQAVDTIGLRKMVAGLRPEYETIINLAYFKGFTLDEISKTLEIPLGTVKTRMRSAIQQLREIYSS
jgi:RNA polymerase sigma-70 factor (ECF subfamily)